MHPILLKLGPVTLYTYGLMLVVAFLVAAGFAARAVRVLPAGRRPLSPEQAVDVTCAALLGGLIGGRLFYVARSWEAFAERPLDILAVWHGGLIWYGGFLGGVLAGWLYIRAQRLSFLRVADHLIPFAAIGHAIGRVGCFLNGCCYGRPTESWCGVVFPQQGTPVLPTQLFEAAGLAALYPLLRSAQRRSGTRPGDVLGVYLVAYGLLRFAIEFLRGDQTAAWAGLTLQQLISIGMMIIGMIFLRPSRQTE
jgi:phosphatidylglycerol:prolipoprotein diacylglycerol transferase